jgi:hypothetical protein
LSISNTPVVGITFEDTPSHGYYWLSPERNAEVHDALRRPGGRYEEDLEAFIVLLYFPAVLPHASPAHTLKTMINHYPDEMRLAGYTFEDSASHALRERAFYAANTGRYIVISACGDWYARVPRAKVLVTARRCRGTNPRPPHLPPDHNDAYFLVDEAEYGLSKSGADNFAFVVDESRHERCRENGEPLILATDAA